MKENTQSFCPNCLKKTEVIHIQQKENVEVRGEYFEVMCDYMKCIECGSEFVQGTSDIDPLKEAYIKYRQKHNMMQPEEIKHLRKSYKLTQRQFATLLGFGKITLSRYERGSLQDEVHDRMLHMAEDPDNLLVLLNKSKTAFSSEEQENIKQKIEKECPDTTEKNDIFFISKTSDNLPRHLKNLFHFNLEQRNQKQGGFKNMSRELSSLAA